jgi:hypothetical protein
MENQSHIRRRRLRINFTGIIILLVSATAIFGQTASPTPNQRIVALGLNIAFTEGEQKTDPEKRSVQRPRVFYRREMETNPVVVARPTAPSTKTVLVWLAELSTEHHATCMMSVEEDS